MKCLPPCDERVLRLDAAFVASHQPDHEEKGMPNLLKIAEVATKTKIGKSTIYRRIQDGSFPRPVSLGPGPSRWIASEIDEWIRALPRAGEQGKAPER